MTAAPYTFSAHGDRSEKPRSARGTAVITRPWQQAKQLAELFQAAGFQPVVAPLTEVVFLPSAVLDDCVARLDSFDGVVATSANSLRVLTQSALQHGRKVVGEGLPCYAVGKSTARLAQEMGFSAVTFAGVRTSQEMASQLLSQFQREGGCRSLFYPHGRLADRSFVETLLESGLCQVTAVSCYDTVEAVLDTKVWAAALNPVDSARTVIALYSPSAVRVLDKRFGALLRENPEQFLLACVGPTTAAACRQAGFAIACVAKTPSDEDVVAGVVSVLAQTTQESQ